MPQGKIIRKLIFSVSVALFSGLIFFSRSFPESFETLYSTVNYTREEDLFEFGKKIGNPGAALYRDNLKAAALTKESLDRIVYRVKAILDMYPAEFHFNLQIYPTYNDLKEAYRAKGIVGKAPIAFYSSRTMTIYVSLENLTDRILAHEIAHAVINVYFSTPPPEQMQEILAQYVDKHLWDEQ